VKALSLLQPWATLIVIGAKKVETRTWRTEHRGLIAIHASQKFTTELRELCLTEPFRSALLAAGIDDADALPRGAIIGTTEIVSVIPTTSIAHGLAPREHAFGDYRPGRFGWQLQNAAQLDAPITCRGLLALWKVPDEIVAAITPQKQ
jgi:hypothetical protein